MQKTVTAIIVAVICVWIYTYSSPRDFNPHIPTEQAPSYEEWLDLQKTHPSHELSTVNEWAPMNIDRCVSLHNEIFRLGCEGMGYNFSEFKTKNWFEVMGEVGAEEKRPLLSKEIIKFLERVHANNEWNFAYWVDAILPPERIADNLENYHTGPGTYQMPKRRQKKGIARYVTLYGTSVNMVSHSEGLIFDQETNKAILCPSIWDGDVVFNGRQKWYPLETVLEHWLNQLKSKTFKIVGKDSASAPWELVDRSEEELEETVTAFNRLVEAIEVRMPEVSLKQEPKEGLVEKSVLDSLRVKQYGKSYGLSELGPDFGFAHAFMSRVRRPRFQYIAPGLSVPTETTISDQPFFDPKILEAREVKNIIQERLEGEFQAPPFLLFRSELPVPLPHLDYNNNNYPFRWPWNTLKIYHAGLYLHFFSDQFAITLPYGIGAKGYARATDGSKFGERVDKKGEEGLTVTSRYADMYRLGFHPFIVDGTFGLKDVLENWRGLVESGDWKVDKNGIANDINEWKKADTADHWKKYVLPLN